jgi:crotonobetainyl-CoA:carnitine CoA-transferase CaiB-like acyl-CoA transferase
MDRLQLGYPQLSQRNPRLVYATLSGYGQSGPYRDRAGHDLNYLSIAGVIGFNADDQGRPFPPAVQIADLGAGTFAALAILAALSARERSGRGQAVDVSLFSSAIAWLPTLMAHLFANPTEPPRASDMMLLGGLAQYDVYETADHRYVSIGALEPKLLMNFLEAIGRPDLAANHDAAYAKGEFKKVFAMRTLAEWVDCLRQVDTCFAPVNALEETLEDPQVQALRLFASVDHPRLGGLPQIAPPFDFSETQVTIRRPPPDLGEHNHEILQELGL